MHNKASKASSEVSDDDGYKLRRERKDLYNRVSKTVNIDYDPKQVKPFLQQLEKIKTVNSLRPLGLATESHFPADLRASFKYMLSPMAAEAPDIVKFMKGPKGGKGASRAADKAFI